MPMHKPSDLMQYMEALGISPKKRLSQNFLLDGNVIAKIVSFADLDKESLVLEIGSGPGALTEALLDCGAHVIAVEKDEVLAKGLSRLQKSHAKNLDIYCMDILEFPFEKILHSKAKIVANLPYHLTTPILTALIQRRDLFTEIIVMIQEEAAQRFISKPFIKDYSSVLLNFYSNPCYGFKVSRNCFFPKPGVDSAVVKFVLRNIPSDIHIEDFFKMGKLAFEQRRKALSSTLRPIASAGKIQECLIQMQKSAMCRPEQLSLEEFEILYRKLYTETT